MTIITADDLGTQGARASATMVLTLLIPTPKKFHNSPMKYRYRKTSNISCTLEHRLLALLQLHLHSRLNIWLQRIQQRQSQDSTRIFYVLGFGVSYIRDLTVVPWLLMTWQCKEPWHQQHDMDLILLEYSEISMTGSCVYRLASYLPAIPVLFCIQESWYVTHKEICRSHISN